MTMDKPYLDVPGTTIFDADQSAKGYHLNQFCMSLMSPENRSRFIADQGAYLDEWELSPEQKQAVLDLDLNECIRLGGNIYFLSKIGATFGLSFQQMAGSMTGMTEAEYRDMMLAGGRSIEGNRIRDALAARIVEQGYAAPSPAAEAHPTITASVYTSHVPAIGAAMDLGKTEEPYWKAVFDGYEWSRQWMADNTPDVVILVYNDHATAFDLHLIPTFVIGTGPHFPVADEGYGPRPVPPVEGDPDFAAHLAQALILDDFDLTLVNEWAVAPGLTVPVSVMFGERSPDEPWPCKVIPLAVNVVQYPVPHGARCYALGRALRRAVESYDKPLRVQIWGTGGMSHQLQGPRAGLINREWDNAFLDRLISDPAGQAEVGHLNYVEEAGSEGIELVMWLIARGAMADIADDGGPGAGTTEVLHRFYHVPASNTAVGHLVLANHAAQDPASGPAAPTQE